MTQKKVFGRAVRAAAAQLRAFDAARAGADAAKADAAWQAFGESATRWFHRLGDDRALAPPMATVRDPATGETASAATVAGARRGADLAADFFDGDKPGGLFAPPRTDRAARSAVLSAIDKRLAPGAAAAVDGPSADGSITVAEVGTVLRTVPVGTSPGLDGLPYEFYAALWPDVAGPPLAAVHEAFAAPTSTPRLDGEFTIGLITLIFKGTPRKPMAPDLVDSFRPIGTVGVPERPRSRVLPPA